MHGHIIAAHTLQVNRTHKLGSGWSGFKVLAFGVYYTRGLTLKSLWSCGLSVREVFNLCFIVKLEAGHKMTWELIQIRLAVNNMKIKVLNVKNDDLCVRQIHIFTGVERKWDGLLTRMKIHQALKYLF